MAVAVALPPHKHYPALRPLPIVRVRREVDGMERRMLEAAATERILMIDATDPSNPGALQTRELILEMLAERGAELTIFRPDPPRLGHCIACFHCWIEEPGRCRYDDGIGRLLAAYVASDTVVWLEPLRFGGHASALKQVLDRTLPVLLPDFVLIAGELSHPSRYPRPPRIVGLAMAERATASEVAVFSALVGRNARNLQAASHASAVIPTAADSATQRAAIANALGRVDPVPTLGEIARLAPVSSNEPGAHRLSSGRALLVVGSSKQLSASTSSVLGGRLIAALERRGWVSETVAASRALRHEAGRRALLEAWDRADVVVLSTPLYFDTLPCLASAALEIVADRCTAHQSRRQRFVTIANSSFPQAIQSSLLLAICARFAEVAGMEWAGGMALGAGAWIEGKPLEGAGRSPRPTGHVIRALDRAAAALAVGQAVPREATELMARVPVRGVPFPLWQRVYASVTWRTLHARATAHGIHGAQWTARPFTSSD